MKIKNSAVKNLFLILFGCILFFLSHPNIFFKNGIGFLAFFSYVPFCMLLHKVSLKNAWFFGGVYGAVTYAAVLFWLWNFHAFAFIFLCIYFFLLYAILFSALKALNFLFKKNCFLVQFLCLCSFEYLRTLGFLGFSYGEIAYSQWKFLPLIQISNITGIFGVNLIVIFPSFLIAEFLESGIVSLKNKTKKSENKQKIFSKRTLVSYSVLWIFVFALSIVYGKVQMNSKKNEKSSSYVKIALIQNNEHPWENGIESHVKNVNNLIELSKKATEKNDIDIVVWPETAVAPSIIYHFYKMDNSERLKLALKIIDFMNSSSSAFLIGNAHIENDSDVLTYFNSTLFFEPQKNIFPPEPVIYSKQHLVPFSENFPLEKYFPHLSKVLKNGAPAFWTAGNRNQIFSYNDFDFVTPICFEDTFGDDCRKMILDGGRTFVNVSNDSWALSEVSQKQHLSMAVFRSAENSLPSVRCTTSGQTCFVSRIGRIEKELKAFSNDILVAQVPVFQKDFSLTFYTKHGDVFAKALVAVFFVLLIIRIFCVIIKNVQKKKHRQKRF